MGKDNNAESISKQANPVVVKQIRGFLESGYNDYIAARFLLNNQLSLQGAILACTAVEKYLKAIIVFLTPNKPIKRIHLDNLDDLKKQFADTQFEHIMDKFDSVFLNELKNIYKFRYHDNFKEATSIGFLVNQFLGELDFTIMYLNSRINFRNKDGKSEGSFFTNDIKNYNNHLLENNYVLLNLDKIEFMNRETHGFCYMIDPVRHNAKAETKFKIVPGQKMVVGSSSIILPKYVKQIYPFRMDYK